VFSNGVGAYVRDRDNKVVSIGLDDVPSFKTPGGIGVGSHELEVRAILGSPATVQEIGAGEQSLCYNQGMTMWVRGGRVGALRVIPKNGC
jgi:hypothetical protein